MGKHSRFTFILGVGLLFGCPPPAAAQAEVGPIARIVEILGGARKRDIREPTPKVQIQRGGTDPWVNAAPRVVLSANERLQVQRFVDARLEVDRSNHRGTLTFLPRMLGKGGERAFPPVGEPPDVGLYGIGTETAGPEDLVVSLDQGALLVDWVHGRLVVNAAGTRTVVTGTTVSFSVDQTGDSGFLFLESGTVTFPEYPELRIPVRELIRLQRGLPPSVWPTGAQEAQAIREATRYHNRGIWANSTPLWQRPLFFLPVAAAIAGGVIWASGDEERTREGTVVVQFPR